MGITEDGGDAEAFTKAVADELAKQFGAAPTRNRMRALVGVATR